MKTFILFSSLMLLITLTTAQNMISDRPGQSNAASVIPTNAFQIESGIQVLFTELNYKTVREFTAPTTLFRYGLFKRFELRFFNEYHNANINDETIKGISDFEIGFKLHILDRSISDFAFMSHVVIPVGTQEKTGNQYAMINRIAWDQHFYTNSTLGTNIGYNYTFEDKQNNLLWSLNYGHSINNQVSIFLESYLQYIDISILEISIDGGLTYLLKENFQLDTSFGFGANYRMNFISAGICWMIK